MSKKKETKPTAKKSVEPAAQERTPIQANDLPMTIHAQYIRDLSFENPRAPESLRAGQGMPQMDISIGMDARDLKDANIKNMYEVALNVRAEAKKGEDIIFIAELQYGTTVSIGQQVPADTHHPLLFIEIPRLIFPYARQVLSEVVAQGGYPPLLLNPVDFHALYVQRFSKDIAAAQKARAEKASN